MEDNIYMLIDEIFTLAPVFRKRFLKPIEVSVDGDLTPTEMIALMEIYLHPKRKMGELADDLLMSKQQLTNVVNHLEKKAYVRRSHDLGNRKSVILTVTDDGNMKCEEIRRNALVIQRGLFSGMNSEELKTCISAIQIVRGLLESES